MNVQEVAEACGAPADPRCDCGAEVTRPGAQCPTCRRHDEGS